MLYDSGVEEEEPGQEEKPTVIVAAATAGVERIIPIPHSYENIKIEYQKEDEVTSDFFNRITARNTAHYFCFLGRGFNFYTEESLSLLVEKMQSSKLHGFGGIYSDLAVMNNGEFVCHRFNPAYFIQLIPQQIIMNVPFMMSTEFSLPRFTSNLDLLSLWDGMIQAMSSAPMYHMPSPIFSIENALESFQVEKEIEIIKNVHYH